MESNAQNTIEVKLQVRNDDGLGLEVTERNEEPFLVISDVTAGGVAELSSAVNIGDIILRVNGIDITELTYSRASQILKAVNVGSHVSLSVRSGESNVTFTRSAISKDGTAPRAARISQPGTKHILERTINRVRSLSPIGVFGVESSQVRSTRRNSDIDPNSIRRVFSPSSVGCGDGRSGAGRRSSDSGILLTDQSRNKRKFAWGENIMGNIGSKIRETSRDIGRHLVKNLTVINSDDSNQKSAAADSVTNAPFIVVTEESNGRICDDDEKVRRNYDQEGLELKRHSEGDGFEGSNEIEGTRDMKNHDEVSNARVTAAATSPKKVAKKGSDCGQQQSSAPKRYVRVKNYQDKNNSSLDTLHLKANSSVGCTAEKCMGSFISPGRSNTLPRTKDEIIHQAKDFLDQYYTSTKRLDTPAYTKRWTDVLRSIEKTGTYELTFSELTFGAKLAWRNAPRCLGRIQWSKLQVFDARHINTTRGMFEAICNHIKYSTNKGNIRSAITIFPPRTDGEHDYRIWNPQLIQYAGYKQSDGSIIGDPGQIEFTEVCVKQGWKPKGGMFDVLPLLLSANGQDPDMHELPADLVLQVQLTHPQYEWFGELGLQWFAVPAVSGMLLDIGGLEFTACPFNGWYMGTEIACRNLSDVYRYNMLEPVAKRMGIDTNTSVTLWKDKALVEINVAVLYSFQKHNVTIVDHHQLSDSFMKHIRNEQRLRGGCPGDWVWLVPPISGSVTSIFHQEMLNYQLKPSYEYMEPAWKTHVWKRNHRGVAGRGGKDQTDNRPRRQFSFRDIARAVKFSAKLMSKALARRVKCTILFATETGKSERFARILCDIFRHGFDAQVMCMENYDIIDLEHEALVLVVTSTFGNGDPPENGYSFGKALYALRPQDGKSSTEMNQSSYLRMSSLDLSDSEQGSPKKTASHNILHLGDSPLSNVRYGVFALGSRAYPNFCSFGHFVDRLMMELGAERIYPIAEGDDLCGQEESFRNWAQNVFRAACDTFCVGDDVNMGDVEGTFANADNSWSAAKYRLTIDANTPQTDDTIDLSRVHNKQVFSCKLKSRTNLQAPDSSRQTILVKLDTSECGELSFKPGDHIGIFPSNPRDLVQPILERLHNAPPVDQTVKLEFLEEIQTPFGVSKTWKVHERIPVCSLRKAFTNYIDITSPPTPMFLQQLLPLAADDKEKYVIERLVKESKLYEDWKYTKSPNILELLEEFSSIRVPATLLLSQLPLLQQRFYSISSSPKLHPSEVHMTVAVVEYRTQGGTGPIHRGICSNWLNDAEIGENIYCHIRTAPSFHLPDDHSRPVIMVGPGTGIAPFRSFWQQREFDRNNIEDSSSWGNYELYFGCRQSTVDLLFKDETDNALTTESLHAVHIALSREVGIPKTYVQHLLKRNAPNIYKTIHKNGGHFYVCGDVSMAADVTTTLELIIQSEGNMTNEAAKAYVLNMRDNGRFHEDIFGVTLRTSEVHDRARSQSAQLSIDLS
ncbi:nitric oxide synthase-like protein [Tubulanus polymorphus]|uniref:nitric oxide synthase-like protein n=1 Tax=Tubulanus polymorphus TaxID=672921 RepID=UPI003DA54C23